MFSERTIAAISKVITGESGNSFYRSGPFLVKFFNELGFNDEYGQGFPSRWKYTEDRVRIINESPSRMLKLLDATLDPRNYIDTEFDLSVIVDYLNEYLKFDGYELFKSGYFYKLRELKGALVESTIDFEESKELNHIFISEQIRKCEHKIAEGDYSGAITNARSLVEAVLIEIESRLINETSEYDGDLIKLYRRVQKLLNLDPGRKDISEPLKQVLSGFNSIVSGLAGMRNKMSDSHVITYRPFRHHAKLAVNSAMTLCDFIFDTYQYQLDKGFLETS